MTPRSLVGVLSRALAEMSPSDRVAAALPARPPRPMTAPVSVIAIGKAAPAMTVGALRRWDRHVADVLIVTPDGTDATAVARDRRVEVLRAGHPVPDRRSMDAADRCLTRARVRSVEGGSLLALVSGGASALVCAPAVGIRLEDKQAVTRAMLASGASIHDINVIRKHLSRIKGGGLARAARPAPVMTLVVSDVIGGTIADVGSGPTVGDTSTVARARRLLARHAPDYAGLPLVTTGPANNVVSARMVASPEELAKRIARALRERGLRVRVLEPSLDTFDELAQAYVALASRLRPGTALVRAAEPSVELPIARTPTGRGGRSTHLAARVGLELPRGTTFLAAATDGVDGSSGAAGAIVDGTFRDRVGESAIVHALERFDTGPLHRAANSALPERPTGHNLADLHVLLRP